MLIENVLYTFGVVKWIRVDDATVAVVGYSTGFQLPDARSFFKLHFEQ